MREKLIELLDQAPGHANSEIYSLEKIADHLIANGVTITKIVTPEKEPLQDEYWGYWGTCPACLSSNPWDSNFCSSCGAKFKQEE